MSTYSYPKEGNAEPLPRTGWIAVKDQRPPHPSPLLLVTNNINVSTRLGAMSHVWLTSMLHYSEDPNDWLYPFAFDEHSDQRVLGITHWRYAIPSEGRDTPEQNSLAMHRHVAGYLKQHHPRIYDAALGSYVDSPEVQALLVPDDTDPAA